jgi:ferrochelatase
VPTGLLLLNLGTPDAPDTTSVRRYLREFLSDPRVIDVNAVGRALLLNLIILPFRPARSAHAYQQIWTDRGSPLLYHSIDLAQAVADRLGDGWQVELAMRYGQPSIAQAMVGFQRADVDRIVVFALFPQYATSSTGTAVARVMELAGGNWNVPAISVVPAFHGEPAFLDAFAQVAHAALDGAGVDHVLFSFHGLPERQIIKSDPTGTGCLTTGCCDRAANPACYRAQCVATARALAARLDLAGDGFTTCFQSRLGRIPWITPHTDGEIDRLARGGVKRVGVVCPAFVADCLETLEEIGIRARDQFRAAGGDELVLVPSLNASDAWADAVCAIARRHASAMMLPVLSGA